MKFSFIIPSFNQGKFIKQTIDSILSQDVEKEIIVMDGGSTDETIEILKSYGDKIYWVSEKDNGQTDAINKGIKKATGEIIAYINSDDYYLNGALKIVEKYFSDNPYTLWLTGDGIIVNENGNVVQKPVSFYKRCWRRIPFFWTIYITNFIIQPSTFFRREVFDKIGLFDENRHYTMDYDYWLRLYREGYRPLIIKERISAFRIHSFSKGGSKFMEQFKEDFDTLKRYCSNPFLKFLHWFHNNLIVLVYLLVK